MTPENDNRETIVIKDKEEVGKFNNKTQLGIKSIKYSPDENTVTLFREITPDEGGPIGEPIKVNLKTGEMSSFVFKTLDGKLLPEETLNNLNEALRDLTK